MYDTIHYSWVHSLTETYDHGYLISGQVDALPGVAKTHAWIIKTDINGNKLWEKRIFDKNTITATENIEQTPDGGFMVIGSTTQYDSAATDIMFIKLDACFNKEWCTILSTPDNPDYGIKVVQVSDGYIGLLSYYQDLDNMRVWTIKLDNSGTVIWHKVYFQDDPGYRNEQSRDILITPDGGLLVTADGYYDPIGGWNGKLRSVLIKTDNQGNEQWITRWGEATDYRSFIPIFPVTDEQGYYFCTATHYQKLPVEGYVPAFIKTSPDGEAAFSADLMSGTEAGIANSLHFLYPDTLVLACGWKKPFENYQQGVIKCDTAGNVIKTKILLDNVQNTFMGSALTFDKKLLLGGGFVIGRPNYCIYLFKVNSNLELDSTYTAPRNYDSLCPHPIVSDTMGLEGCGIYTSLPDPIVQPDVFKIKAYPVPAKDRFTIQIPEQLLAASSMGGVNINTIYHQWDKTTLQIIDINGRVVYDKVVYFNEKEVEINCSAWPAGFYAARLAYKNMKVGEVKVMVVK